MLKAILGWFTQPSLQKEIDAFIASRNPTTTAEVDYWVTQFLYARGAL